MKIVSFDKDPIYIGKFIDFPKSIYDRKSYTQNDNEVRQILLNTHVLSKYFKLKKFIVLSDENKIVGRFVITMYRDDKSVAYIGFFECINDSLVAKKMFDAANKFAKKNKYKKLIGPVDSSFWLKYRLKVNLFDKKPYIGEPYNKDYYLQLFQENGYKISESYVSNIYDEIPTDFKLSVYKKRFKSFTKNGYTIVSPKRKDWEVCIREVYRMLMDLYSDFPIFKFLREEDFVDNYSNFKSILNMRMVKMAYYDGKAVGFFIGMPDYGNDIYNNINIIKIIKILYKRYFLRKFVMLYMGVDSNHHGLGKAIIQTVMDDLYSCRGKAIGALIKEGKVTEGYVSELINDKYKYVLLERSIR